MTTWLRFSSRRNRLTQNPVVTEQLTLSPSRPKLPILLQLLLINFQPTEALPCLFEIFSFQHTHTTRWPIYRIHWCLSCVHKGRCKNIAELFKFDEAGRLCRWCGVGGGFACAVRPTIGRAWNLPITTGSTYNVNCYWIIRPCSTSNNNNIYQGWGVGARWRVCLRKGI